MEFKYTFFSYAVHTALWYLSLLLVTLAYNDPFPFAVGIFGHIIACYYISSQIAELHTIKKNER